MITMNEEIAGFPSHLRGKAAVFGKTVSEKQLLKNKEGASWRFGCRIVPEILGKR
jgi:hypothetical protein